MIFTTNASMHYENSKSISIFLGKNRFEIVIETIQFNGALPKVPDISVIDYCAFQTSFL